EQMSKVPARRLTFARKMLRAKCEQSEQSPFGGGNACEQSEQSPSVRPLLAKCCEQSPLGGGNPCEQSGHDHTLCSFARTPSGGKTATPTPFARKQWAEDRRGADGGWSFVEASVAWV